MLALTAGCSGSDDSTGADASPTTARSPQPAAPEVLDDLFEVEPGRSIHLRCEGSGPGTVLLEAGGGSSAGDWPARLIAPLSERARTCSYDRAGTGTSDPAPERRRVMKDVVSDLDALLVAAHVEGKLLLVGTSFGGEVMLNWALHHADRTAGLVILDTDWPTTDVTQTMAKSIPAAQRAEWIAADKWDAEGNDENIDYQSTAAEDEDAFRTLPGIPIRILSAAQSYECAEVNDACRTLRARLVELQKQWLKLSPTAQQVVVDAGHNLPSEATDIVVGEIEAALGQA